MSDRRNSARILYYDNLALRSREWEPITELNNTTLQKITAVCLKHHGWFVASSSFDDQRVVLMKEPTNDLRVHTRRLTFRIIVEYRARGRYQVWYIWTRVINEPQLHT
jgi:ABC-type sugar transport system ATPase subunit